MNTNMTNVIDNVLKERSRQDSKWGEQNHGDFYWLGILAEEFGEVAKALIEYKPDKAYQELVETVAVGVGWLECIERRTKKAEKRIGSASRLWREVIGHAWNREQK